MKKLMIAAIAAAAMLPGTAQAAVVYTQDFEANSTGVGGLGSVQSVAALPSGTFGKSAWYNGTSLTGAASATTLGLSGIGAHTTVSLDFDFIAWNSWDGSNLNFPEGDFFEIWLDGAKLLTVSPANATGAPSIPPEATLLLSGAYGYGDSGPYFNHDSVYHISLSGIVHTAATANFQFRVTGPGWQGDGSGVDEAFGLDNIVVSANISTAPGVPEPASWAMMIGGFALLGATMRRRVSVAFA